MTISGNGTWEIFRMPKIWQYFFQPKKIFRHFFHICFGNMKYGKGDGSKRRRAWVFGMKCCVTQKVFLRFCPRDLTGKYKWTKAALWPFILAPPRWYFLKKVMISDAKL